MWNKLVERFVTVATMVTFAFVATYVYLVVTNQDRPADLITFLQFVLPLYFGTQIKQKERSDS
jgi:hypothetical protein